VLFILARETPAATPAAAVVGVWTRLVDIEVEAAGDVLRLVMVFVVRILFCGGGVVDCWGGGVVDVVTGNCCCCCCWG